MTKTSSATDSKYQACIDEGRPADLCRELQKGSPAYQRCIDEAGSTADLAKEFCRRKTEETTTSTPKVAPNPEGQTSLSCDYLLGSGLKDYSFIGGGPIKNTGNIGIVVKVKAKWPQLGSDPVVFQDTYRVAYGRTKRVKINMQATQDQIDRLQSSKEECSINSKIVDTFGDATGD